MKLGHALTFYAKYPEDMDELYRNEARALLDSLPESEREEVIRKIEQTGDRARIQCKELLRKCAEQVESTFQGKCRFERRRLRDPWSVHWYLWRSKGRTSSQARVGAAISVWVHNHRLVLQSSLWVHDERKAKEILKRKHAEIGTDLSAEWSRGDLVFKEVPIVVPEEVDDLEADALIARAIAPLETLTKDELEKIFDLARP